MAKQALCVALALWSHISLLARGTRELLHVERASAQLYHPGHGPVHITRLHRYDHSGLDAFLEREAAWAQRDAESSVDARELQIGEESAPSFLQLSQVQADALHTHQQAMLQQGAEYDLKDGRSMNTASAHYRDGTETLSRPSPSELAVLQRFAKSHTGLQNGHAVTGLSSLMSQYVGPIGVGTTVSPEGCNMPGQSATSLLKEKEGSSNQTAFDVAETTVVGGDSQACNIDDQSKIWVVFDTGSTNIWISSDLCESGPCAESDRQRYNHTESLTFSHPLRPSTLTVQFGTGKLVGPQAVDDLHIGPFTVFNQTFAMIENEDGRVFHDVPFEGILGLAYPSMSANKVKPFFDTVIEQKALENNEFSVYFNRDTPTANAIFWGGVDKRFFTGDPEYFPVTDPYYWSMDLHAFKIGKECLFGPGCSTTQPTWSEKLYNSLPSLFLQTQQRLNQTKHGSLHNSKLAEERAQAIVDTGTTYFTAEGRLFSDIMSRLPPRQCKDITHKSHPNLTWTLKNARGEPRDFVFTKDMYMISSGSGSYAQCSPAFMRIDIPVQHGPGMVLGEVFLRNYYAVFDRGDGADTHGRIGFAPSLHSKDVVGYLRDLTHSQPSFQEARAKTSSKKPPQPSESAIQRSQSLGVADIKETNEFQANSFVQRHQFTTSEAALASSDVALGVVSRRLRHQGK